jgi:hypothetical protein
MDQQAAEPGILIGLELGATGPAVPVNRQRGANEVARR